MHKPGIHDLRWLLGSLALVMALHLAHLAVWISLFMIAFGVWRYQIAKNGWQLPRLAILLPLTLLAGLGIMLTYKGLFGRDASVALLAIMLSLKLMETRQLRDYVLLVFAGYFLTITAFLFSQSILVGAFILLPVLGLTATLISVSHPNGVLGWRFPAKLAGSLLLQAVPVMLILFFLFPRIPGPLWGVPEDSYKSMSGLSDSMQPGNISQLSLSAATAFHVQFQGAVPGNQQLYWRGPVLWHYDGRSWTMRSQAMRSQAIRSQNGQLAPESLQSEDETTDYTVTLEPHNRQWLLMLDIPVSQPADTQMSSDRQVLSREPVRTRIRYQGSSHLHYRLAQTLDARDRELALQLNDDENPRSFALAQRWSRETKSAQEIVNRALTMFRQQPFVYTLAPPRLGNNPMDDFLFNTRRGFCEHYASSFVFLMRAAGVPARVVTGYQGGELNPVGNYLIVRQSDAHAWAEVWLQDRGWVRVDPTAAVSPQRVESGINAALPDSAELPMLARRDYPLLRKLYLNWDAVNNGWNQYVLGYNQQRQLDLLARLMGGKVSWQDMVIAMMAALALAGLVIAYFVLRGTRLQQDPLQLLYARFQRKLARTGLQRLPQEGPQDFGRRAMLHLPSRAGQVDAVMQAYIAARYGAQHGTASHSRSVAEFKRLVTAF